MDSRLSLKEQTPIASGKLRLVYSHPNDSDLLIKVYRPSVVAKWNHAIPWWKRPFRRFKYYIYFVREVQEHIAARLSECQRPKLVQTVVGFVDTDFGLGLVTQAERNRAGELAPTLYQLVHAGAFDDSVRKAFEAFAQSLLSSAVIVGDIHAKNLVYSFDETHGEHFVIIDGLGEKNWFPVNSLSPIINRHSKLRRIRRLRKFIENNLKHPRRECGGSTMSRRPN